MHADMYTQGMRASRHGQWYVMVRRGTPWYAVVRTSRISPNSWGGVLANNDATVRSTGAAGSRGNTTSTTVVSNSCNGSAYIECALHAPSFWVANRRAVRCGAVWCCFAAVLNILLLG